MPRSLFRVAQAYLRKNAQTFFSITHISMCKTQHPQRVRVLVSDTGMQQCLVVITVKLLGIVIRTKQLVELLCITHFKDE